VLKKKTLFGAIGLALVLAGCNYNRTPNFAVEAPARPLPADYRQQIIKWAKRYYVEPGSVTFLGIADPVPVLTEAGKFWLVCIELDARERGGAYMGPRRIALGMLPGMVSAPMERQKVDIRNEDCEAPQLVWRAWSDRERKRTAQRTPR
jgi:hypothetical protein